MTYLIVFLLIGLAMAAGTVRLVARDGRGPAQPPRSHHDDLFVPTRPVPRVLV